MKFRIRKRYILLLLILLGFVFTGFQEFRHINSGVSRSIGSVRNGRLENGYLLPYKARNFDYFSPISYYLLDNAYVHSKVYYTLIQAFEELEQKTPDRVYSLMECSHRNGGRIPIHRTHMNGLSVDFMVPKVRNGQQIRLWDKLGIWHYALDFDPDGRLWIDKKTKIDFDAMSKAIITIDDASRKNGLKIRKIILKVNLKDNLYATQAGQEIRRRGIYIVKRLAEIVDRVHDDHFHIDFEEI
ncbi:MAG: hypothetical protein KJP00_12290 [Bacteroidia bacterium]|nr:hypothetical protein [Bacteroidia bacterium]